jgi:hypothetical protein
MAASSTCVNGAPVDPDEVAAAPAEHRQARPLVEDPVRNLAQLGSPVPFEPRRPLVMPGLGESFGEQHRELRELRR